MTNSIIEQVQSENLYVTPFDVKQIIHEIMHLPNNSNVAIVCAVAGESEFLFGKCLDDEGFQAVIYKMDIPAKDVALIDGCKISFMDADSETAKTYFKNLQFQKVIVYDPLKADPLEVTKWSNCVKGNLSLIYKSEQQPIEPIIFDGCTHVIAKSQPYYLDLPVRLEPDQEGVPMHFCFEVSPKALEEINKTKKIYFRQLTFGGKFQPVSVSPIPLFDVNKTESNSLEEELGQLTDEELAGNPVKEKIVESPDNWHGDYEAEGLKNGTSKE